MNGINTEQQSVMMVWSGGGLLAPLQVPNAGAVPQHGAAVVRGGPPELCVFVCEGRGARRAGIGGGGGVLSRGH